MRTYAATLARSWERKMSPDEWELRGLRRRRERERRERIGAAGYVVTAAGAILWAYIIVAIVWGVM